MHTTRFSLRSLAYQAWAFSPLLTLTILVNLFLIPATIAAALLDPVVITGVNGWIKPLKFAISITIYASTFLWLLTYVRRRRAARLVAGLTGAILLAEIALIVMQVARGVGSHFNMATPFDAAVFSAMGMMITTLGVLNLLAALWLSVQQVGDRPLTEGVRWGAWITVAGIFVAFLMTMPTAAQLEAATADAPLTVAGAHSVGVADGGPGLPLVGWSTTGGDLRIPHFVGLHALQLLPLLGWALGRPRAARRWSEERRVALVRVGGAAYAALLALLTWQALRGQSIVAPDLLTLAVAGLIGVGTVGAALWLTRPVMAGIALPEAP